MSEDLPPLQLKPREDRRLRGGHLWVFSNEVDTRATPLTAFAPGELARVVDDRGAFVGFGYVNPAVLIAARLLSRSAAEPVGPRLFESRLALAQRLRCDLGREQYGRWVFGESDRLPGLILDRFGSVVVGQTHTQGMERLRDSVAAAVARVPGIDTLVWKNDSAARELEGLASEFHVAFGTAPKELTVIEGSLPDRPLRFAAPLERGQKTGWFYDQTDNRARLARLVRPG
ncbi:MAG: RlmI/RlmK family 23S rRNA methyltransferase, partial [Steroidobacteraceae bacterium]|nr:RlmI/RlmK family 23S rRNA methyltransferase [Steroidobacteraceae bacterium]MDW8258838.1 RlmI/RlmK family 23S rRNA methyltransferase [Gammaproteobacteria bacterium]